jgi:hypothetical protein
MDARARRHGVAPLPAAGAPPPLEPPPLLLLLLLLLQSPPPLLPLLPPLTPLPVKPLISIWTGAIGGGAHGSLLTSR